MLLNFSHIIEHIIILWAIFFVIWLLLIYLSGNKKSKRKGDKKCHAQAASTASPETSSTKEIAPNISVSITTSHSDDEELYTNIAGVKYRCNEKDQGGFLGYTKSEPENEHDPNAVAVYRNDGKMLGYIPTDRLDQYHQMAQGKQLSCIGFVRDGDYTLFGKVKIIKGDRDIVEYKVVDFVQWLVQEFGVKYIPDGFTLDNNTQPKTKKEWLTLLNEYLDNNNI